eukprot:Pgem_evm1s2411
MLVQRSIEVPNYIGQAELITTLMKNWHTTDLSNSKKIRVCAGCDATVVDGDYIFRLDRYWHKNCYHCHHCKKFPEIVPYIKPKTTTITKPDNSNSNTTHNFIESDINKNNEDESEGDKKAKKKAKLKSCHSYDSNRSITLQPFAGSSAKNKSKNKSITITKTDSSTPKLPTETTVSKSKYTSNPALNEDQLDVSIISHRRSYSLQSDSSIVNDLLDSDIVYNDAGDNGDNSDDDQECYYEHFFEENGKPYCQKHWYQLFGVECEGCKMKIASASMVLALKKSWHAHCFKCSAPN